MTHSQFTVCHGALCLSLSWSWNNEVQPSSLDASLLLWHCSLHILRWQRVTEWITITAEQLQSITYRLSTYCVLLFSVCLALFFPPLAAVITFCSQPLPPLKTCWQAAAAGGSASDYIWVSNGCFWLHFREAFAGVPLMAGNRIWIEVFCSRWGSRGWSLAAFYADRKKRNIIKSSCRGNKLAQSKTPVRLNVCALLPGFTRSSPEPHEWFRRVTAAHSASMPA